MEEVMINTDQLPRTDPMKQALADLNDYFRQLRERREDKPATNADDPDHFNHEKGGNRLSDDYWEER
jgi:hypothetical protein